MLFKVALIALCCSAVLVQSLYDDREPKEDSPQTARFFALRATSTIIKIQTQTATFVKQSLCASLVNVTGACQRRKRGADKPIVLSFDEEDNIDLYKPSPVQPVEPTPAATLDDLPINPELIESSNEAPVEVDIIGLQSDCVGRRFGLITGIADALNVTLRFTTKLTATVTVTKTVISGVKPFFISGCTPSPFYYQTC